MNLNLLDVDTLGATAPKGIVHPPASVVSNSLNASIKTAWRTYRAYRKSALNVSDLKTELGYLFRLRRTARRAAKRLLADGVIQNVECVRK